MFLRLIQRDMRVLRSTLQRRVINTIIWTAVLVYVFEYVGLSSIAGLGLFIAASESVAAGLMRTFSNVMRLIGDLQGPRALFYYLTLPIPQWLVFVAMGVSTSLQLMIVDALILPAAKLVLWDSFHLTFMGFFKVICVFICAHLLYGAFFLLFASFASSMNGVASLRMRIADPLFWTGAYFFSWHSVYAKSHFLGYLNLLNPVVYACEGMRSAIFGNPESLPVWLCCVALLAFTAVIGTIGTRRMMKKVDCL